jgi:hypothetical protein
LTLSGTHAWDPTVLVDTDADEEGTADEIIWNIEHGRCPRCEGPLPTLPEYPAGSRITECRSIPICGRCGSDEVYEAIFNGWISSAGCWPLPQAEIEERRARARAQSKSGIISASESGDTVITEEGAGPVTNPATRADGRSTDSAKNPR